LAWTKTTNEQGHAQQRTAPGFTACDPTRRPAPTPFPHRLRRPRQSLSLGSNSWDNERVHSMSTQVRRYEVRTGVAPVPPGVPPSAGALAGTHCKDKWTGALKFQGSGTRQDAGRDSRDGCSPRQLPLVNWEVLSGKCLMPLVISRYSSGSSRLALATDGAR